VAVFEVAATEMVTAGHVFHRGDNDVWLIAVVPPAYLALKRTNP
jgi:putative RNA 2'-phosphotransferase